jgi:hypothetical protein
MVEYRFTSVEEGQTLKKLPVGHFTIEHRDYRYPDLPPTSSRARQVRKNSSRLAFGADYDLAKGHEGPWFDNEEEDEWEEDEEEAAPEPQPLSRLQSESLKSPGRTLLCAALRPRELEVQEEDGWVIA